MTIDEFKQFFSENPIPKNFKIDEATRIVIPKLFLESSLRLLENERNERLRKIFYNRLMKVVNLIKKGK